MRSPLHASVRTVAIAVIAAGGLVSTTGVAGASNDIRSAHHPLKPVHSLRASHITTSSVKLTWRNPSGRRFKGVLIRDNRGKKAPTKPTRGHKVASLRKPTHTYRVTRLKPATTYSFAVFARYGKKYSAPADVTITTRRAPGRAVDVSAGENVTCAVLTTGQVKCWGFGGGGMLGNGHYTNSSTPVLVSGISTAVAVAVGDSSVCAILSAGTVKCWGDDYYGELGNGHTSSTPVATPVAVSGLAAVRQVGVGVRTACALTSSGAVKCWGDNELGMLGDNDAVPSSDVPVGVIGLSSGAAQLGVGYNSACVVMTGGSAKCWGDNNSGQIGMGDGGPSIVPAPQAVVGLSNAARITVGFNTACVVTTGQAVECWGESPSSTSPVAMSGWGSGIAAVSAGGDIEIGICALSTTGKATCEGDDYYGGLGNGTSGVAGSSTPVGVSGLSSGVRKISVGVYTSCAVTSARGVDCWGHNDYGQLGNGSTAVEATRPVAVKL